MLNMNKLIGGKAKLHPAECISLLKQRNKG